MASHRLLPGTNGRVHKRGGRGGRWEFAHPIHRVARVVCPTIGQSCATARKRGECLRERGHFAICAGECRVIRLVREGEDENGAGLNRSGGKRWPLEREIRTASTTECSVGAGCFGGVREFGA